MQVMNEKFHYLFELILFYIDDLCVMVETFKYIPEKSCPWRL